MLDDPNAPEEQSPPEAQPAQPEPAPQVDINQAYDIIAQQEGWDPRLTRYEIQELKRKREEFDRERREFEALKSQRYEVPDDGNTDPYMREIRETRRLLMEDREERRKERETSQLVERLGSELNQTYTSLARQNGLTKEQMDAHAEEFYSTLTDLYPQPGMLQEIGIDRAARAAFRFMSMNGKPRPIPNVQGRGPTATRTIPGSPQPYVGAGNPMPPEENLSAEQLEGETDQQYLARLERIVTGANAWKLPDGMRVRSRS